MSLQALMHRWKSEDVGELPAETPERIKHTFLRLGFLATPDVVRLYSTIGGMQDMGNGYLRIWSLQEIEEDNDEPSEFGLLFADHLLNSWCYRLKPEGDVNSYVYVDYFNTKPAILVAKSLDEFLEEYAQDPRKVHA